MGCTPDILFGRTSRQMAKLKLLLALTVSRLAVLRNQRTSRCSHARQDCAQLLLLHQHYRALLRAEQVIREQNILDAFVMIEDYCHLLTERATMLDRTQDCLDELREACSGLIFVASRCGDLPELQKVRRILVYNFGSEFAAAAVELRNNCGVNPKLIQKMSTRQPSLESKIRVAKEIGSQEGITLDIEEPDTEVIDKQNNKTVINPPVVDVPPLVVSSVNPQYRDAATAAQAAFESAAYAAAAARIAVELSRPESLGKGSGSQSGPDNRRGVEAEYGESIVTVEKCSSESEEELVEDEKEGITMHSFMITEELMPVKHKNSYLRPPYRKGKDEVVELESTCDQKLYRDKPSVESGEVPVSMRTRRGS